MTMTCIVWILIYFSKSCIQVWPFDIDLFFKGMVIWSWNGGGSHVFLCNIRRISCFVNQNDNVVTGYILVWPDRKKYYKRSWFIALFQARSAHVTQHYDCTTSSHWQALHPSCCLFCENRINKCDANLVCMWCTYFAAGWMGGLVAHVYQCTNVVL